MKLFKIATIALSVGLVGTTLVGCSEKEEIPKPVDKTEVVKEKETPKEETKQNNGVWEGEMAVTLTEVQPSIFEIKMKNQTESVQKISFNSGQMFDYIIKDEQGNKVATFSEGMMFTQAIVEQEIKQGAELSFVMDVKKELGSQLKPGKYTIEAWIIGYEDNKQTLQFEVSE